MTQRIKRGGQRWVPALRLLLVALTASRVSALSQQYCASFNTGSGKQTESSTWMTNGKCHDQCNGYAFGVVQGQNCWCSNIAPADAGSTADCSINCPGFPSEQCGNEGKGLYGYVALGPAPQGTQGASSSSSSTSNTPSPSPSPSPSQTEDPSTTQQTSSPSQVTVPETVTVSQSPSVISPTPATTTQLATTTTPKFVPVSISLQSSSSTSTTSISSKTSSKTSSTWTPTPVTSVETVTNGQLRTMTITPSAPPASTQTVVHVADAENGGFFSSPGKVAGVFIVVALVIVAILAGLIFFFWRRKRRHDQDALPSTAGSGTPQRRPSRMSQMGLIGAAGSGSQKEKNVPPTIQTTGWGPGNSADRSPADTLDRRSSYPRVVDQRLEPTALWNPLHDNGSHVSVRSFRDDQDYSRRMLRVANPDQ